MAPLRKPMNKDEADRRVSDILDFAGKLLSHVRDRNPVPSELQPELENSVKRVASLTPGPAVVAKAPAFDTAGTELWNGTTNILRDVEDHQRDPRRRRDLPNHLTVLLRVFAFYLLDAAYRASPKRERDFPQRLRNFKLALKTCRTCLDSSELDPALKILEKCSDHVNAADTTSPLVRFTAQDGGQDGETRMKTLAAEFYLLRVMHAWKSGRLDLAAHHANKSNLQSVASEGLGEKAADLFYEISKFILEGPDTNLASEWLERALGALNACDVEQLSDEAADLRLSISTKLVRSLSVSADPSTRDRASLVLEQLIKDPNVGNRLAVQVMQLDVLLTEAPVQLGQVQSVVERMMRTSVLTDQTFKIIMQAMHRIKKRNTQLAGDLLTALIHNRLLPNFTTSRETSEADRDRLEKACVTYALFTVSKAEDLASAEGLRTLLHNVAQGGQITLSTKAVHAMQTLIWKAAGSDDAETAGTWLHILQHPAFDTAGQANKARIGRKAIYLALQRNDINAAREAYFEMLPAVRNENMTQFLVFKLALRSDDYELARESLDTIASHIHDDGKFLYACVLEAQESNMRHIAVAAFAALLDKQPRGVHLPTLLRCTVRLLAAELDASSSEQIDVVVNEVVEVFEKAAANVRTLRQATGEQWRAELQWWSKNAYNLSLRLCGDVHPEQLCRLLATCITFIDNYPNDSGVMHDDDLKRRKLLCRFLSASALIVLGRSAGDGTEYSLQSYLACRQQVQDAKALFDTSNGDENVSRSMFELLKYDVECILRLQQWDQLNVALQACLHCEHVDRWDTLADLVLIIHGQSSTIVHEGHDSVHMIALIQKIINETWKKDKDLVKVSRWLRLSFSIDLSDGDGAFALKLLQQAADMAKKGYEGSSEQTYPETELQWLATTAFNKAVDLLSGGKYDASKEWIEGALELARYAADSGALHGNLTYKKGIAMKRIEGAGEVQ